MARSLLELLKLKNTLVSDGAWGTALQAQGLQTGECPERWNLEHSERVLKVAQSYIKAGSQLIETNSFGGSSIKLEEFGLAGRDREINRAAAQISREAAGSENLVLGSIGPSGKMLMMGEVSETELLASFSTQAAALQEGGADALCLETFFDLGEARAAIQGAQEASDLEIVCTFTFQESPRGFNTLMGHTPAEVAETLAELGVSVIGSNCGTGFKDMLSIVKDMHAAVPELPILVHANAGLPELRDGKLYYPEHPDLVAEIVPALLDAGVSILGGCCGTTPEHIRAIRDTFKSE